MDKPIPAYYSCYLLRSTIRHASLYVGSTPNPVRRLRQHNGDAKGGAAKTSRDSLRPWEMTCLVSGFPSSIAALQFEWAWQNTHLTRHISPNSRSLQAQRTVRFSPKTGRARKRAARPRLSLSDRLANLHQLLRASSFARWPLKVTFYSEDVFRVWQKWTTHETQELRPHTEVALDNSASNPRDGLIENSDSLSGIHAIDVGYKALKQNLERSRAQLSTLQPCVICRKDLPPNGETCLVCPNSDCRAVGHIDCFASSFLDNDNYGLVPIEGLCPSCGSHLKWIDLVKELSLRMRAPREVEKILKEKKTTKAKTAEQPDPVSIRDHDSSDDEDAQVREDEAMDDSWNYLSDSSESDISDKVVRSDPGSRSMHSGKVAPRFDANTDPIIEDSDRDDAEVIT